MNVYKNFVRPPLFLGDPEAVHHLAMTLLRTVGPMMARLNKPPDR